MNLGICVKWEIMIMTPLKKDYKKGKKANEKGLENLGSERAIERRNTGKHLGIERN